MLKTMGRRIPIGDERDVDLVHSLISLSLQMAWISATIAVITALCIRRKSSPPNPSPSPSVEAATAEAKNKSEAKDMSTPETTTIPLSPQAGRKTADEESQDKTENGAPQELPLPPAMKTLRGTYSCNNLTRSTSMRRVDSLKMKVGRSMSVRNHDLLNQNKKKGKLKTEDSVWKKTIILGEKCRPDEEDDEIIYDKKGNKIPAYHKKSQSNFSLSRTNSYIDTHAIPGQDNKDKGIARKDEEVLIQQLDG